MSEPRLALFVRLHAKPGKEDEVASFLSGALELVRAETGTRSWYALRFDEATFGIFDTFADEKGRQAHLTGAVADALMQKAPELFREAPVIEELDLLAVKPG